jgi:hypothetical protein
MTYKPVFFNGLTCGRAVVAVMAAICAACGGGNDGASPPAAPTKYCSTGTQLVLFYPVPGTKVASSTKSIYVASNSPLITEQGLAARPNDYKGGKLYANPLAGPVAEPTPTPPPTPIPTPPSATPTPSAKPTATPTPFPTPPFANAVYYVARGFSLKPQQMYHVDLASLTGNCLRTPIRGGIFYTFKF